MNGLETDSEDRIINPPKILTTEVVANPFDDIGYFIIYLFIYVFYNPY
jgi:hypothetical protein